MGARFAPEKRVSLRSYFGLADPSAAQEAQAPQADDAEAQMMEEEPTRPCRACPGRMHLTAYTPRPTVREILEMPLVAIERAQRGIVLRPGTPGASGTTAPDVARVQRPESLRAETEAELSPSTAHW